MVEGTLQIEGEVIHVVATKCFNLSVLLRELGTPAGEEPPLMTTSRADEKEADDQSYKTRDKRVQQAAQGELFFGGRNFR